MDRSAPLLALVLLVSGCVAAAVPPAGSGASARVTGTVSYRERLALQPGVVVRVQLADVSRADAPALVLGQANLPTDGAQIPLPFEIAYDPSVIRSQNTYAVRAWIEDAEGRMRFSTDERYAVITRGAASHVDLSLKSIGAPAPR